MINAVCCACEPEPTSRFTSGRGSSATNCFFVSIREIRSDYPFRGNSLNMNPDRLSHQRLIKSSPSLERFPLLFGANEHIGGHRKF